MDVELRSRRLVLRQPRPDDAPRIVRYLNNFRVAGNLARVPYPYRDADAHAWLRTWRPPYRATRSSRLSFLAWLHKLRTLIPTPERHAQVRPHCKWGS